MKSRATKYQSALQKCALKTAFEALSKAFIHIFFLSLPRKVLFKPVPWASKKVSRGTYCGPLTYKPTADPPDPVTKSGFW
jgi:hypothetical protein